jgi:hypothetical protein
MALQVAQKIYKTRRCDARVKKEDIAVALHRYN